MLQYTCGALELEEVCIRKSDGWIMLYMQSGVVTVKHFQLSYINVIYMQGVEHKLHAT